MGCFYEHVMEPHWSDKEFRKAVRLSRASFMWLRDELAPHITKETTPFKRGLVAGQRLAMALWYLASGGTLQSVAHIMNCGTTTVWAAVHDVCNAIVENLRHIIRMPNTREQLRHNAEEFFEMSARVAGPGGIPQMVGVVDGTHVAVEHKGGDRRLFNRKGYCSLNVQGVCDASARWIDVQVGNAGSMHDARAFHESDLYNNMRHGPLGPLLWSSVEDVGGVVMPYSILADSAYMCETFVLPCYKQTTAEGHFGREAFNSKASQARITVERAFGYTKQRWRVLLKRTELSLGYVTNVILACFILHNVCEEHREPMPRSDRELFRLQLGYARMFHGGRLRGRAHPPQQARRPAHGRLIREALARRFAQG
ncbi:hypothetical protein QJQ45_001405 [Haematococcus lacustris]|nr:hypothetical protein QJQ45_001405 [Haematococcus lacustris]